MMGPMGHSLVKWVRRLRPRKPFSMDRKPHGDTIHRDSWEFEPAFGTKASPEEADARLKERAENRGRRSQAGKLINRIGLIVILGSVALLVISYQKHAKDRVGEKNISDAHQSEINTQQNEQAYLGLVNYGEDYLLKRNPEEAIRDFKSAQTLYPFKYAARFGLAKAYTMNCQMFNNNCQDGIMILGELIEAEPASVSHYELRGNIFLHLKDTIAALADFNRVEIVSEALAN